MAELTAQEQTLVDAIRKVVREELAAAAKTPEPKK